MRSTDERMTAVLERAGEMKEKQRLHRSRIIGIVAASICIVIVLGAAFAMPGLMRRFSDAGFNYSGGAASLFYDGGYLGYIIVGSLAFILGVFLTVLCYRLRQRERENE